MKTPARKRPHATQRRTARSRRIPASRQPSTEQKFLALLRRKCMRAATVGALTAAAEAVPGIGRVLGLVFGELLDAKMLAAIQRELIEETFALYDLQLPDTVKSLLVNKVLLLGTGASVTGDVLMRTSLKRALGRFSGMVASRTLPIASIFTSALSNAAVTYVIGKRAQAVARLREAPIAGMPDVLRAFTGVDERRIYGWTVTAVKNSLSATGKALSGLAMMPLRMVAQRRNRKA